MEYTESRYLSHLPGESGARVAQFLFLSLVVFWFEGCGIFATRDVIYF